MKGEGWAEAMVILHRDLEDSPLAKEVRNQLLPPTGCTPSLLLFCVLPDSATPAPAVLLSVLGRGPVLGYPPALGTKKGAPLRKTPIPRRVASLDLMCQGLLQGLSHPCLQ